MELNPKKCCLLPTANKLYAPSVGMTTTKILKDAFLWHTPHIQRHGQGLVDLRLRDECSLAKKSLGIMINVAS